MSPEKLYEQIQKKQSFLCVGLDTDWDKIPEHLKTLDDPIFEFNRQIIKATLPYAVAYKPNWAFYEAMGTRGLESLKKSLALIPDEVMVIADAKRGDIGNTARQYARAFFEDMDADAITIAPYMGRDSILPFLEYEDKWTFVLALTSNAGADDFQYQHDGEELLYQRVLRLAQEWAKDKSGHLGFVVGATRAEKMAEIRKLAPDAFFLVPGIGAQGGDLEAVCRYGQNDKGGLLINSSRGIIYAGQGEDFSEKAAQAAEALQKKMAVEIF